MRGVREGCGAMEGIFKGFLNGGVLFVAHVTGVEDEPEEKDDHGDEHEAWWWTSWHFGQR